jgi:uncharacterized membrane protein
MRVLAAIGGAILAWFAHGEVDALLGVLLGAFAGYAIVELAALRRRVEELEAERRVSRTAAWRATAPGSAKSARADLAAGSPGAPAQPSTVGATPVPQDTEESWLPHRPWKGGAEASSALERVLLRRISEYFTGGNLLVRVGVLILFFGVAFLLRYIVAHTDVPLKLQLLAVAAGGVVMLVLGLHLRRRRPGYALTLQGGGVGILYLTTFAALRFYSLLEPATTFMTLVALAVVSAALAVIQDSRAFAVLAVSGGFLAPILASVGDEQLVTLFGYYAVLNLSILAIAWYRAWRELNFVGFLFTFVLATGWGVLRYHAELFASTEPFLALFFLLYLGIATLFAFRQPPQLRGYVDTTIVFGTPIAAFGYQSAMLLDRPLLLAESALTLAVLYFLLSWLLDWRFRASHRLLAEAFFALGIVFLTLAVPLSLDGRQSAATWALEGAALVWIGCRQLRALGRAAGALLMIGSGLLFLWHLDVEPERWPVVNGFLLTGGILGAASVFCAVTLRRYADRLLPHESPMASGLVTWGFGWWIYTGLMEIVRTVPDPYGRAASLVFLTGMALAASAIYRRTSLGPTRLVALSLLPVMGVMAIFVAADASRPLADGGWFAWPIAFAGFYVICRRHEGEPEELLAHVLHTGSAWLLTVLVTWEVVLRLDPVAAGRGSWPAVVWALVPGSVLALLPWLVPHVAWPLRRNREAYLRSVCGGIALYLVGWTLWTLLTLPGDPYPFDYMPVLNVLDLAEAGVLVILSSYWGELRAARQRAVPAWRADDPGGRVVEILPDAALVLLIFLWLNAIVLRTLHFWADVPYDIETMVRLTLVQTVLSIFWTVIALAAMLTATRRPSRLLWLGGAGLLAIVDIKLFAVDLSHIGTLERVVSFIGVGVHTLVIGYFSPLPPQRGKASRALRRPLPDSIRRIRWGSAVAHRR